MNREEILNLTESKPRSFTVIIRSKNKEFYDKINTEFEGEKFAEKLYRYLYPYAGKCKHCGLESKFVSFFDGFNLFCGKKCSNTFNSATITSSLLETNKENRYLFYETKNCLNCNIEFESLISKKRQYCNLECANKYTSLNPDRANKIRETNMSKYGVDSYSKTDKFKEIKNKLNK